MRLAILSDTHGLLRPQVVEYLKTADAILHGGDINKPAIVEQLQQFAPPLHRPGQQRQGVGRRYPPRSHRHVRGCHLLYGSQ